MDSNSITIPTNINKDITLDSFVHKAKGFKGFVVDFRGDSIEETYYARTRISDLYQSRLNLFGYLELSKHTKKDPSTKLYFLSGVIEVRAATSAKPWVLKWSSFSRLVSATEMPGVMAVRIRCSTNAVSRLDAPLAIDMDRYLSLLLSVLSGQFSVPPQEMITTI